MDILIFSTGIIFLTTWISIASGGERCLTCVDTPKTTLCERVATCGQNQECYTEMYVKSNGRIAFDFGCKDVQMCSRLSSPDRHVLSRRVADSDIITCSQCCNGSLCNAGLCGQPGFRIDQELLCYSCNQQLHTNSCDKITQCGANQICQLMVSRSPVNGEIFYRTSCADIQECNTFLDRVSDYTDKHCYAQCCNTTLCNSVTCDHQPDASSAVISPPASTTSLLEININSSVNGNWSTWGSWSSCSTSCGVGLKQRERTCSNPRPDKHGNHCFGDSTDYGICSTTSCGVSSWSGWGGWSSCSVTCGVGLRTRHRACKTIGQLVVGAQCDGLSGDADICTNSPCKGWTEWSSWGHCSSTCGTGLRNRTRKCLGNTIGGRCDGNQQESSGCNDGQCPGPPIAFFVRGIENEDPEYAEALRFFHVEYNEGSGYNHTTGVFTAPVQGVYLFSAQLCDYFLDIKTVYAINIEGTDAIRSEQDGSRSCFILETISVVKPYDRVKVTSLQSGAQINENDDHWNTFSGTLLNQIYRN